MSIAGCYRNVGFYKSHFWKSCLLKKVDGLVRCWKSSSHTHKIILIPLCVCVCVWVYITKCCSLCAELFVCGLWLTDVNWSAVVQFPVCHHKNSNIYVLYISALYLDDTNILEASRYKF